MRWKLNPAAVKIHVGANKTANEIVVDISDSGPGVPPERRSEIFEFGKTSKVGAAASVCRSVS